MKKFDSPNITVYAIAGEELTPDGNDPQKVDANGELVHDKDHMHGYPILDRANITSSVATKRIMEILQSPRLYHSDFALCFDPGMAIRLEQEGRIVDLVICLSCAGISFKGSAFNERLPLSGVGVAQLRGIYRRALLDKAK